MHGCQKNREQGPGQEPAAKKPAKPAAKKPAAKKPAAKSTGQEGRTEKAPAAAKAPAKKVTALQEKMTKTGMLNEIAANRG